MQKSRDRAALRGLAPLLVAGFAGCQLLGQEGEPEPARAPALEGRPQAVLTYPNLHTVPPRPQLSYSVEQQREIVEQLISDREHARYTDRLIRYESGLSSLPPPPAPPPPPDSAAVAAQVVQAAPQAPAAPPGTAAPSAEALSATTQATRYRADDGSLDDVMEDLVTNTRPPTAGAAPPAGSPAPAAAAPSPPAPAEEEPDGTPSASSSEDASPPPDEARSLGDRLFGWIGDLFGEEAAAKPEAEPSPAPEGIESASGGIAASGAAGPMAYARPSLKPMHVATPPWPSPVKPEGALADGTSDHRTGETNQGALAVIPFSPGSALLGAGYDAAIGQAFAGAAGAPVEVRARGGGRALAVDRARAVALALMRAGARPEDLELVISGSGPDEVRVVAVSGPS